VFDLIDPPADAGMPRRFGVIAGIVCFAVWFIAGAEEIFHDRSSTAAIGLIFLPFYAAIASLPEAAAGWCLGRFLLRRRSQRAASPDP
jgi:hypothetical protein